MNDIDPRLKEVLAAWQALRALGVPSTDIFTGYVNVTDDPNTPPVWAFVHVIRRNGRDAFVMAISVTSGMFESAEVGNAAWVSAAKTLVVAPTSEAKALYRQFRPRGPNALALVTRLAAVGLYPYPAN